MELPRGTFDLILLNHNFHYFAPGERVALLRRAQSRLVENGVLAVQTLVLTEGILPSLFGLQAGAALFDLLLRTHRNLHGLPEAHEVHARAARRGLRDDRRGRGRAGRRGALRLGLVAARGRGQGRCLDCAPHPRGWRSR